MKYTVAVLGGGPAGAMAALCLARAGIPVALIEAGRYQAPRIGETLVPAIAAPLRMLGLWAGFQALQPLPSHGVRSAWGAAEPTERSLLFDPHGPAWQVDRCAFDRFLADAAASAGATLLTGHRFHAAEPLATGGWCLRVTAQQTPQILEAGLVIDATGRAASFARRQGATRRIYDNRVGIVGRLEVPADWLEESGFVLIESVAQGWWYSAPSPPGEAVAVLITDADLIDGAPAAFWRTALATAPWTTERIRALRLQAPAAAVLADTSSLDRSWGAGWIAVGDAAAACDPLSGDGVLRAMADGIGAAQAFLTGGVGRWPSFAASRGAAFMAHRLRQQAFARRERRWPEAVFWAREQGRLTTHG